MPRMRSQAQIVEESHPEQEEEVRMATKYIVPRVEDAPEVTIPKGAKFPIPLPSIDPRVKEDGDVVFGREDEDLYKSLAKTRQAALRKKAESKKNCR